MGCARRGVLFHAVSAAAFTSALSIGVLCDYYLWELDGNTMEMLKSSLPTNLEYLADIYTAKSSLGYSFWLLCGGLYAITCYIYTSCTVNLNLNPTLASNDT